MGVEDLLDRPDCGGTASRIDGLIEPGFLAAGERLAEQLERFDDSLHLGREGLELDVGNERKVVGAAARASRHEADARRKGTEPRRSQSDSHGGALRGGTPRLMSRMTSYSPNILTASSRQFNEFDRARAGFDQGEEGREPVGCRELTCGIEGFAPRLRGRSDR